MTSVGKTVLILAYECYPHNKKGSTVGAQRPYQFSKHLSKFGWRCITICCSDNKRWTLKRDFSDDELSRLVEPAIEDVSSSLVQVGSLKFGTLLNRIWLSTVTIDQTTGVFIPRGGFVVSFIRKMASFLKLMEGDYSIAWVRPCFQVADRLMQNTKIDIIIAEHGPFASISVARLLHRKYSVPWLVDFRDPVLQPYSGVARHITRLRLRKVMASASCMINVNHHISSIDQKIFGVKSYTVANGFDFDEISGTTDRAKEKSLFILSYLGSIYPQFLLQQFLAVLTELCLKFGSEFKFVYRGSGKQVFEKIKLNFYDSIDIGDVVDRQEYFRLLRGSHATLIFSIDRTDNSLDVYYSQGVIPTKYFEIAAQGTPIICFPGDEGELESLINLSGTGWIARSKDQLVNLLGNLIEGEVQFEKDKVNHSIVHTFSRENQTRILAEILDRYA